MNNERGMRNSLQIIILSKRRGNRPMMETLPSHFSLMHEMLINGALNLRNNGSSGDSSDWP